MAHLQIPMVVRSPPCTAPCFSPGAGEPRNFWETDIHKSPSPCPGHLPLCSDFIYFSIVPLFSYKQILPKVQFWCHLSIINLTQLPRCCWCLSTSKTNFSHLSKVSDLTAALPHEQGCAAILQNTRGWVGTPAGSLSKSSTGFQWHIQASLTFWKMVLLCLLFLTISSAKPINKARYSESNGSCHSQQFLFPSFFPHLDAKGAAQWEAIRGENGPHLL